MKQKPIVIRTPMPKLKTDKIMKMSYEELTDFFNELRIGLRIRCQLNRKKMGEQLHYEVMNIAEAMKDASRFAFSCMEIEDFKKVKNAKAKRLRPKMQ